MNINRITIIPIFAVFFGCMYGAHATEYVTGLRSYITHNLVEVFSANDTISDFYFVSPSDLIQNLPAGQMIMLILRVTNMLLHKIAITPTEKTARMGGLCFISCAF